MSEWVATDLGLGFFLVAVGIGLYRFLSAKAAVLRKNAGIEEPKEEE